MYDWSDTHDCDILAVTIATTLEENKCTFQILGGVAGSEDFACATLPTTPFDFQGKIKIFCHPTLLKIRFKMTVTPPPPHHQ